MLLSKYKPSHSPVDSEVSASPDPPENCETVTSLPETAVPEIVVFPVVEAVSCVKVTTASLTVAVMFKSPLVFASAIACCIAFACFPAVDTPEAPIV